MNYKSKVESFWSWFASVAERFHKTIEDGNCSTLQTDTSAAVDQWLNSLAWPYGPGEIPGEHSLTLSPNGILHHQFLTDYWLQRAPSIPGWRFYSSRQSSKTNGVIEIGGERYGRDEMWVTPVPDADRQVFNLTVWHPKFLKLDETSRSTVMFLWLDEILSEHGTVNWVGSIKINDDRLRESMLFNELPLHIQQIAGNNGWKKYPPGQSYTGYKLKERGNSFLRADTIAGTTSNMRLIGDYLAAEGNLQDPLDGFGADFIFVSFPSEFLPAGQEATTRGKIEDVLENILRKTNAGRIIGGATGVKYGYIDAVIFAGDASIALIRQELKAYPNLSGAAIHYFAAEKRHLYAQV